MNKSNDGVAVAQGLVVVGGQFFTLPSCDVRWRLCASCAVAAIAPANGRIHCVSVTCVSVSVPCWPCAERACVERYSAIVDHRGSAWQLPTRQLSVML